MSMRNRLIALFVATSALSLGLGCASARALTIMCSAPPAWWGPSQVSAAVVLLAAGAGSLGAGWHALSALTALVAESAPSARSMGLRRGAALVLARWGAPAVRRLVAGGIAVALVSAPALAAPAVSAVPAVSGDDLGWRSSSPAPTDTADPATTYTADPEGEEPTGPAPTNAGTHVVAPGESLWSITADLLGAGACAAEITEAWPSLYAANSHEVGADPDLIRPGQVLDLPVALTTPPPAETAF